jgi:hypothetical protein
MAPSHFAPSIYHAAVSHTTFHHQTSGQCPSIACAGLANTSSYTHASFSLVSSYPAPHPSLQLLPRVFKMSEYTPPLHSRSSASSRTSSKPVHTTGFQTKDTMPATPTPVSPSTDLQDEIMNHRYHMTRMQKERDDLSSQLSRLATHIASSNAAIALLRRERDAVTKEKEDAITTLFSTQDKETAGALEALERRVDTGLFIMHEQHYLQYEGLDSRLEVLTSGVTKNLVDVHFAAEEQQATLEQLLSGLRRVEGELSLSNEKNTRMLEQVQSQQEKICCRHTKMEERINGRMRALDTKLNDTREIDKVERERDA